MGIEPTFLAWEANVLPLNYTRSQYNYTKTLQPIVKRFCCRQAARCKKNRDMPPQNKRPPENDLVTKPVLSHHNDNRRTVNRPRAIRSYVRREGRLTPAQQRALTTLWWKYGIELGDGPIDFQVLFGRNAPITLEIGFGDGVALAQMAEQMSQRDFVGIEVHRPGIGRLLRLIEAKGLSNVRLIEGDAVVVLRHHIGDASLDRVLLLFPDPWPKKRHHKRRIVQTDFVELLAVKLKAGGLLRLVTDWENYAEQIVTIMQQSDDFKPLPLHTHSLTNPLDRPATKFERRGLKLGHAIYELAYQRSAAS